jgi:hypothetical protein
MSHDFGPVVEKVRLAIQAVHNDFRSLYDPISDPSSIPISLQLTDNTLTKLTQNIDLLARYPNALSSEAAQKVFDSRMSDDIKLSDAILRDMATMANRLQLMTPLASSKPVITMKEDQCRDIAHMAARYDQAITSILLYHNSCVHRLDIATMICLPY